MGAARFSKYEDDNSIFAEVHLFTLKELIQVIVLAITLITSLFDSKTRHVSYLAYINPKVSFS